MVLLFSALRSFSPRTRHLLPAIVVMGTGLAVQAAKVKVTPHGLAFKAGSAGFQCQAVLEGEDAQPGAWDWTVVGLDGRTVLADAGSVSAGGFYTPPPFSLSDYRMVRVKATAQGDDQRSGSALLVIRPHAALGVLETVMGRDWRGARIEFLAGGPRHTLETKEMDHTIGSRAQFRKINRLAFAPRIPGSAASLRLQWLVADGPRICRVSQDGAVHTLADASYHPEGVAFPRAFPNFTRMAATPWTGSGEWACYLWDGQFDCLWKMDGDGRLEILLGDPADGDRGKPIAKRGHVPRIGQGSDLVADGQGNVYLSLMKDEGWGIYRMAPDRSLALVAGSTEDAGQPVDGAGSAARFVRPDQLTLDETGQVLYLVDGIPGQRHWLRAIDLNDGKAARVTTLGPKDKPLLARGKVTGLALHRGKLLMATTSPELSLLQIDRATGRSAKVFHDPTPSMAVFEGPCTRASLGLPPRTLKVKEETRQIADAGFDACGSLGAMDCFAVGAAGQICVGNSAGGQLGLLLLDWEDPATPLAPAVETKHAPGDGKSAS